MRSLLPRAILLSAILLCLLSPAAAAEADEAQPRWQWVHPVAGTEAAGKGKTATAYLWIPPTCQRVRGVLIGGMTLIEADLTRDAQVRRAAADAGLAILLLYPQHDAFFDYKTKAAGDILQRLLTELAEITGYAELAEAPLLTVGHSTGGHFARNVAFWRPERVIAVLYLKSGQIDPPSFDAAAEFPRVPFLAVNGQLEEFGPGGAIPPGGSRESQWHTVRDRLLRLRATGHPVGLVVEPGAGHFAWSDRLAGLVAEYIRAAVALRVSDRDWPRLRPVTDKDGWLSDSDLGAEKRAEPAPVSEYRGDPQRAFWHPDKAAALAAAAFVRGPNGRGLGGRDQFVSFRGPDGKLIPPAARISVPFEPIGDGRDFTLSADFLSSYPAWHARAGEAVGHAEAAIRLRVIRGSAVATGPNRFRLAFDEFGVNRSTTRVLVLAEQLGDAEFRHAEQPVEVRLPERLSVGRPQKITFAAIGDQLRDAAPLELTASSDAGLPVELVVRAGPAVIEKGRLRILGIPPRAKLPIAVTVMAWQWGRVGDSPIQSAEPVERRFLIREKE